MPKLKCRRTTSTYSIPEVSDNLPDYMWKNVTISKKSKELNFSNKNLTDQEIINEIEIFSQYHNIK